MLRQLCVPILLILLGGPDAGAQADGPRLALVIEQTSYGNELTRIALAKSEADLIEAALQETGFAVTRRRDLKKNDLADALDSFRRRLERAGPLAIGFVYYTGHGAQHPQSEDSYLLGVDARLQSASDLAVYGIDMQSQRDGFASTGAAAVFLIFDACRNVPSLPGWKSGTKGLARVDARADMLIAFSTSLNDLAQEGVYAPILAEEIRRAGQTAESAFAAAQRRVAEATGRRQLPWTNNLLYNTVCFAGCAPDAALETISARPSPKPVSSGSQTGNAQAGISEEQTLLDFALQSGSPAVLRAFAERYPGSVHMTRVRAQIDVLEARQPPQQAASGSPPSDLSQSAAFDLLNEVLGKPAAKPITFPATGLVKTSDARLVCLSQDGTSMRPQLKFGTAVRIVGRDAPVFSGFLVDHSQHGRCTISADDVSIQSQ